jgi:hypothetical protein
VDLDPIERDVSDALARPVPALRFQLAAAGQVADLTPASRRRWPGSRRGVAGALLAGGLAMALIAIPTIGGWGPRSVSAQELIGRTGTANRSLAGAATPYHLVTVAALGGSAAGQASAARTETWVSAGGDERSETTVAGVDGSETFGMAVGGGTLWLYRLTPGSALVARVANTDGRKVVALSETLTAALASYIIPGCLSASVAGEQTVAGRVAYLVEVRPTPATCVPDPAHPDTIKAAHEMADLGRAMLAIDKETDVTLSLVQYDGAGTATYSYIVERFETGSAAAGTGLPFVPSAGATVIETADYSSAKSILAGK